MEQQPRIKTLLRQLQQIQEGGLWIYEHYNRKISTISEEAAFSKPLPNMISIAEMVMHLTEWRRATIHKLDATQPCLENPYENSWVALEKLKTLGWSVIKKNYDDSLDTLLAIIATKEDHFLDEMYFDTDYKVERSHAFLLEGVLHHDIYHLGQIGIVLKLINKT